MSEMSQVPSQRGKDPQKADKFTIAYTILICLLLAWFAFVSFLDQIFNIGILLVPLVFIPALAIVIHWVFALIWNLFRWRWRRLISVVVAPLIAGGVYFTLSALNVTTDTVRLAASKHHYLQKIGEIAVADAEPRLVLFKWGETGGPGLTNVFQTLVYDESDEIALDEKTRSEAWLRRAGKMCPGSHMCSILGLNEFKSSISVKKLDGHFYLITEVYQ